MGVKCYRHRGPPSRHQEFTCEYAAAAPPSRNARSTPRAQQGLQRGSTHRPLPTLSSLTSAMAAVGRRHDCAPYLDISGLPLPSCYPSPPTQCHHHSPRRLFLATCQSSRLSLSARGTSATGTRARMLGSQFERVGARVAGRGPAWIPGRRQHGHLRPHLNGCAELGRQRREQ